MDYGFENRMDFAMYIDRLDLANLVGKVLDKIVEFKIFIYHQKIMSKGQTAQYLALRK